jgi:hypothetical protein
VDVCAGKHRLALVFPVDFTESILNSLLASLELF